MVLKTEQGLIGVMACEMFDGGKIVKEHTDNPI
jgi:hypothetical protein